MNNIQKVLIWLGIDLTDTSYADSILIIEACKEIIEKYKNK